MDEMVFVSGGALDVGGNDFDPGPGAQNNAPEPSFSPFDAWAGGLAAGWGAFLALSSTNPVTAVGGLIAMGVVGIKALGQPGGPTPSPPGAPGGPTVMGDYGGGQ